MKSNNHFILLSAIAALATLTTAAEAAQPLISYLTPPTTIWNQAIQTIPSQNNAIAISPPSSNNSWLYVTSVDQGTLSKLNPSNGKFVQYYDKLGIEAKDNGRFAYGQGGIEFYIKETNVETSSSSSNSGGGNTTTTSTSTGTTTSTKNDGGSYLLYWVLDVSQQGYYSKIVCVEHDEDPNSKQIVVRWVATLSGILNGMPKIGSDGKVIYLTINADRNTPISVNTNNDDVTTESSTTTTTTNDGDGGSSTEAGEGVSPEDEPPSSSSSVTANDNEQQPAPKPYWFLNYDSTNNNNNNILCDYGTDFPQVVINGTSVNATLFETRDECCTAQPVACNSTTTTTNETTTTTTTTTTTGESAQASSSSSSAGATTNVPDAPPAGEQQPTRRNNRHLQAPEKSGRFIILHADTGNIIYSFDSRSEFTIRKHDFGPLGIARRPAYGNYAGGEGNTNDVVMWGSGSGPDNDDSVGETLLFQLPKGFDATSLASSATLEDQFETRVMESVSWTTETPPTFSKDGLAVYFFISGDRLTGWNKGQKFDVAPNVGPVDLSVANPVKGRVQRPIVLADNDKAVLVGVQDTMYGVDVSRSPASVWWKLNSFGSGAAFTTPQITPDGTMAYFGKSGALHAVNLTAGGTLLWEDSGYVDPFSTASQITMADFSLDASGQTLYYCRGGSDTITALKIGELTPTEAPTSSPSMSPSVTASMAPSTSMAPTLSMMPTNDPNYIFPSISPSETLSDAPSLSVKPTISPTKSLPPTIAPVAEPTFAFVYPGSPTPGSPTSPTTNNTAAAAGGGGSNSTSVASAKNNGNTSTFPLSMPAIIGIAVGGGVGLILLLGSLCYLCRKKPCKGGREDDGVDTDWQSSNNANQEVQFSGGGGEGQTHFQYGDEESDGQYGEPLKW